VRVRARELITGDSAVLRFESRRRFVGQGLALAEADPRLDPTISCRERTRFISDRVEGLCPSAWRRSRDLPALFKHVFRAPGATYADRPSRRLKAGSRARQADPDDYWISQELTLLTLDTASEQTPCCG
jgi:hypothetical protein